MIRKERSLPFLVMGLMGFVGFVCELALVFAEKAFGIDIMGNLQLGDIYRHWLLTYVIWAAFAFVLHRIARYKYDFNMFSFRGKVSKKSILIILAMCAVHILYATYNWGWQIKPYAEYLGFAKMFPNDALLVFAMQMIYYFFEGMLLMVIIAFGQEFGERKFSNKNLPWGGILLALTWGAFHWITKFSLETAISCSVIAVYFGVCYLLLKKNAMISWLLFFIVYTL